MLTNKLPCLCSILHPKHDQQVGILPSVFSRPLGNPTGMLIPHNKIKIGYIINNYNSIRLKCTAILTLLTKTLEISAPISIPRDSKNCALKP